MSGRKVWTCKIGGTGLALPPGADKPMRDAVWAAFDDLFGCAPEFIFSGWGGDLDESELAVIEDREPDPDVIRKGLADRLANLPATHPDELREAVLQAAVEAYTGVSPWHGDRGPTWERVADAILAVIPAASGPGEPPEGCEWVALPVEVVTELGAKSSASWLGRLDREVTEACRLAVARRKPAAPSTERVPWYRAPGRRTAGGDLLGGIVQAYPSLVGPGGMYVEYELPERNTTGNPSRFGDGTIEVLAEEGAR